MSRQTERTRTEATLLLAEELIQLLKGRGIPYLTGGLVARAVFEKGKRVFPCVDLYIRKADMELFVSSVKGSLPQNRATEQISAADSAFQGAFRYADTTTTLIDSYDMCTVREMGIHVRVIPLAESKQTGYYQAPNANGIIKKIESDYLEERNEYMYEGISFSMPVHLGGWYEFLFENDGTYAFPSYNNVRCIVSTTIGYGSIIASMDDWTGLAQEMDAAARIVDETTHCIDERDLVLNGVMDALRGIYEADSSNTE